MIGGKIKGFFEGTLLTVLLIVGIALQAFAQENLQSIKVAVTDDYPPLTTVNILGKSSGLYIDVWKLWSKKTGVPVEFVRSSWRGTLESLRAGTVDVHSGLFHNEDRAAWMDFSQSFYQSTTGLYYRDPTYSKMSLSQWTGRKVGVVFSTFQETYLRNNFPAVETVGFENVEDLLKALVEGNIQGALLEDPSGDYLLGKYGLRGDILRQEGNILENAVHAAVLKERKDLLDLINNGFSQISDKEFEKIENHWIANPNARYFAKKSARNTLNQKEREWLQEHPITRLAVLKDWPPYDLMDEEGRHDGLHKDLIDLMNKQLGTAFVAIPFDSWKLAYEEASHGRIDGIMGISRTKERTKTFLFSPAYYYAPATMVAQLEDDSIEKLGDLKGKKIWVRSKSSLIALIREKVPSAEIFEADTQNQGLDAIRRGEGDVFLAWLSEDQKDTLSQRNLRLAGYVDTRQGEFLIGSHKSLPIVASIIHKAINSIPQEALGRMRAKWFSRDEEEDSGSSELSDREKAWIASNPTIRVGNETDWPPFDYMENGEAQGYSIGLIKLIAKKVGLKVEFVNGYTWSQLLGKFAGGEIDVMPAIAETEERKKTMRFTDHYLTNPTVIVVPKDAPSVVGLDGLKGKSVGIVKEFYYEHTVRENYPGVKVVAVDSFSEGLKSVQAGGLDAFIGSQYVIDYLIKKETLTGVKLSGRSGIDNVDKYKIRMAVRKERPLLASILQKGLRKIEVIEDRELREKWIWSEGDIRSPAKEINKTQAPQGEASSLLLQIGGIALIIVLSFILLSILLRRFSKAKDVSRIYDSPEIKLMGFLAVGMFLSVAILSAIISLQRAEEEMREEVGNTLKTVLKTTQESLHAWLKGELHQVHMLAKSPGVRYPVEQLLAGTQSARELKAKPQQSELKSMLATTLKHVGVVGIDILSPKLKILSSSDTERIGKVSKIKNRSRSLDRIFVGKTTLIPPFVDLDNKTVMVLAAPIKAYDGKLLAILALRINPDQDFSRTTHLGQIGETGETYALDRQGFMVTSSRFEKELAEAGLIPEGASSILNLQLTEPSAATGTNPSNKVGPSSRPLTKLAQEAIAGRAGTDTQGYTDYRGLSVLGAWLWDQELGLGLATEMDEEEALATFNSVRLTVFAALGGTVLLALALTGLSVWIGQTATRSLAKARDDLELRVKERTAELSEMEAELRVAMDNMPGGLIYTDQNLNVIFCNDRYFLMADLPKDLFKPGMPYPPVLKHMAENGYFGPGDPDQQVAERIQSIKKPDQSVTEAHNPSGTTSEIRRQPIEGGGTVTVITDITQRKEAERKLENALDLITESINYASHIQRSLLPPEGAFGLFVNDHFEIWEPKDVVGGDLYWCRESKGGPLIAVGDCTGHGVPGAFMTLISTGALNQALLEFPDGDPANLLVRMNQIIKASTGQEGDEGKSDDGLEMGICRLDRDSNQITYAGARFPLFVVRNGEVEEIRGDKKGLGYRHIPMMQDYTNIVIETAGIDGFYLTSDGLVDQIGGPKRRGFGKKRFKALLAEIHTLPMALQKEKIQAAFAEFQGNEPRRDDLSVVGFRV